MNFVLLTTIIILLSFVKLGESGLFVCNEDRTKIIEFEENNCNIFTKRVDVDSILTNNTVMFVEDKTMNAIEEPCRQQQKYGFIFPGTLWCGQGTKATRFNQLGEHDEEDKCCREHDNCPNSMVGGECKNGLCNTSPYTRSHCDCDLKFQECLKETGTSAGNLIGAIFFNIVRVNCFREENCESNAIDDSCSYSFEDSPKYRVGWTLPKNGRKLNLFERFLRKVKLLR